MKYGYKEVRTISQYDIRRLCIKNDYFTNGTNDEYLGLLTYGYEQNITTDELVEMATLIKEHSDTERGITDIMFELAEICHSFFEEV